MLLPAGEVPDVARLADGARPRLAAVHNRVIDPNREEDCPALPLLALEGYFDLVSYPPAGD